MIVENNATKEVMSMTDSCALRQWVSTRGLKFKAIAKAMGIAPYSLQRKIDNQSEFKASEITIFVEYFGMSLKERDEIFFNSK